MAEDQHRMEKFDFLIGEWILEYRVPKSAFSEAATGTGIGTFRRALHDKFVYFDYSCYLSTGEAEAHGVFAWDEKMEVYRYWWFESSGSFLTATCNFVNNETLFLNWQDTLLSQTFKQETPDRMVLKMKYPNSSGEPETILEVISTRK